MATLTDYWPPSGLRITEGDLTLSVVAEHDLVPLVDAALSGIHDQDRMPFSIPWTLEPPDKMPANMIRYFSSVRSVFTAESFDLLFTVRVAGEVLGVQSFHTGDFALTRTGETGSWLRRDAQGRGTGTRMRRAVCAFVFDELHAVELTSGAFLDNPASLAVSRKVGYRPNGLARVKRRPDEVAVNQKLVLTPETFLRGPAVQVSGAAAFRAFIGLSEDGGSSPRIAE